MRSRRTPILVLLTTVALAVGSTAVAKPPGAVIAPADSVTIEILESSSAFTNEIHLWGPGLDLEVTDNETGALVSLETKEGGEIKFEIRPTFDFDEDGALDPAGGPWRSGPAERNPDGAIHALVTPNSDGSCSLVEFEDLDASTWPAFEDEPNYVDAVFWVYPDTTEGFDTSTCPAPS